MESSEEIDLNKFFKKILYSIFFGLLWLFAGITAGIYFELATFSGTPAIINIIFYACLVSSFVLLIRYYIRVWKN